MSYSNRQTRKAELTRQSLKDAFIDLILENGSVEYITVSEITDRADFNRGTFYTHYEDKIDILEDLYQEAVKGIYEAATITYKDLDEVYFNQGIPSIKPLFEHINKHKKLFKALDLIDDYPTLYNRLEECLWYIFTEEIQLRRDTATSEEEYEILLSFEMQGTIGVIKYWIKTDLVHSVDFMIEQLTDLKKYRLIGMSFLKQN